MSNVELNQVTLIAIFTYFSILFIDRTLIVQTKKKSPPARELA